MTKSRDTADSINRIDSSAADATAITIDSSENVLAGKTSSSFSVAGIGLMANNQIFATATSDNSLALNRLSTSGDIAKFYKDGSLSGVIGTDGRLGIGTGDTGLYFNDTLNFIAPLNAGTLGYRDNAIDLGYSLYRFKDLYLSGGAYIGGTGSANYLDDYEEGTWTPTAENGFTGLTFDSGTCQYTKVGNVVHVWGEIYSFTGTSSALWQVSGLPFVVNKETAFNVMFQNVNLDSGYTTMSGYAVENTDDIRLYELGDNIGWGNVLGNQTGSSTVLIFSLTYLV